MLAFEVYVNKVKVCTAGIGDLEGIFSSLVCAVNQDGPPGDAKLFFSVSAVGGTAEKKKLFNWVRYEMYVGSRVEIRIIDASKVDPPRELGCAGDVCVT